MGCAFSKRSDGQNADVGSSKAAGQDGKSGKGNLNEPPPPAPTDPRIPLNARQCFSIGKSWKGITRAMESTGVAMFIALFQEHDELRMLFTKFHDLKTREEQSESQDLQQHATTVMSTLDESINSLDNADFFFDLLHQIGRSHRKIPGFKKEYFMKIEKPFLSSVKGTLGDRYTENMEAIYEVTIRFILDTLTKGYELAEAEGVPEGGTGSAT